MLSTRILTALLLAPPVLAVMFFAPAWAFELLVGVAFTFAAWEWGALMSCTRRRTRGLYALLVAALLAATSWALREWAGVLPALIALALAWWAFVLAWLVFHPQRAPSHSVYGLKGLCGLLTLVPAFAAVSMLHRDQGAWLVLFLLALVWLADVGAYFFGRAFGRHKLAPQVSPGKTWEGVVGAYVATAFVVVAGWAAGLAFGPVWYFALVCLLTVAISIIGDLAESMFKRQQGVKDSGTLLPGHGGMLDRIDSLTSAAPAFTGGLLFAGQF
ncbi:MAG: phosphatidate cytidylyltransferase [Xanthomonadaceae bacterium]|nr:phosphatidate cytidylyltransferase [Xanthomonadaceae bacterium]